VVRTGAVACGPVYIRAVFFRIATLALAQAFDLATFWLMVWWRGPSAEANPLVARMLDTLGLPALSLAKLAVVILVASLAVAAAARGTRGIWAAVGGIPLALAIAAGLIGGITNAATFLG
jgi:hypothetical protein